MPLAGMDNRVVSLANRFVDLGHDTSIFTFFLGRDDINTRVEIDIHTPLNLDADVFLYLSRYSVFRYLFSIPVAKWLRKVHSDILCVDYTPMDWYAFKTKRWFRWLRCKIIYTFHGIMSLRPDLLTEKKTSEMVKHIERLRGILNGVDLIVSVSNFSQNDLKKHGFDSVVIPNGVDTRIFTPNKTLSNLKKTGPILLHVGRIMPHKGVHLLIDAFKQVKKEVSNASLYILGPAGTTYHDYLFKVYKSTRGINDSVLFLQNVRGGINDELLPQLYSMADIFTCASRYEAFGMPFLEAQACGTPCVGFNVAAIPEVVKNGHTGLLVEDGNVNEMAEAIIRLLIDDELRERMGRAARKHAEKFDWNIIAERTLRTYEKIT